MEQNSVAFVHAITESGRILPSAGRWNSIEIHFGLLPKSHSEESTPSNYSKSVEFNLTITDKTRFYRFVAASTALVFIILAMVLLLHFLPRGNKDHGSSKNITLAVNQALTFFDAQKSGSLLKNLSVTFRGDSGLQDGNSGSIHVDLVGGFYDSGNNVKFGFPTAYTITLLSWTVIEYHQKYADIKELDHVKNIIKWGSDYLLKSVVFWSSTDPPLLYSQVGSTSTVTGTDNDVNCWQRPEDITYQRPVSRCSISASDLAGETVAALSAASLVFKEEKPYSKKLTEVAEKLFQFATKDEKVQEMYTSKKACGGEAIKFYNSSGYLDELVWGGTWLFFATGNTSYLKYATETFTPAMAAELPFDQGIFNWNNKLVGNAVLLTRLRYFHDPGYPYEAALKASSTMIEQLMCSYISNRKSNMTPGGLILVRPDEKAQLQYAATAAFLSKLYSDYIDMLRSPGVNCGAFSISSEILQRFSMSQVDYILGDNPQKMSYLVGFGDNFPTQVHHRGASIPWDNQHYSCAEGNRWLYSKDPNPNVLVGAMVSGPDQNDKFLDKRDQQEFTEPSISSNAGLVAALIALNGLPLSHSTSKSVNGSIDHMGIFVNIRQVR